MKVTNFQVVHFTELNDGKPRQVILIYALGEDGNLYEFAAGRWLRIPIKDAVEFVPRNVQVKEVVVP